MKFQTLKKINEKHFKDSNKVLHWRNNPEIHDIPLVYYKKPIKRIQWKEGNEIRRVSNPLVDRKEENVNNGIITLLSDIKDSYISIKRKFKVSNIKDKCYKFRSNTKTKINQVLDLDKTTKGIAGLSIIAPLLFMVSYIFSQNSFSFRIFPDFCWFCLVVQQEV